MTRHMKKTVKTLLLICVGALLVLVAGCNNAGPEASAGTGPGTVSGASDKVGNGTGPASDIVSDDASTVISTDALDDNELTHLMFMREEEKLARDVYIKSGMMYPESVVFGNIDDSEQLNAHPQLAFLSPSRFGSISGSFSFPFPAEFTR